MARGLPFTYGPSRTVLESSTARAMGVHTAILYRPSFHRFPPNSIGSELGYGATSVNKGFKNKFWQYKKCLTGPKHSKTNIDEPIDTLG